MAETVSMERARTLALPKVKIDDGFWSYYISLVRGTVVPYQWEALNDRVEGAEPSGAVRNFKIAAGLEEGDFYGFVFQDSDVAKWLEAVGYLLAAQPDPDLEAVADGMIDLVAAAQHENGYLNTYFTIRKPGEQWTNLMDCHELYCAGHMIEAGVAYYKATGKRKLLDVVIRFADYIDTVFGNEPGKLRGYDGHQEIELALVKLYETTGDRKYLNLSRFFIDQRGTEPNFLVQEADSRNRVSHWGFTHGKNIDLAYFQAHEPVREQQQAVGHAVRFAYMLSGMIDVAAETGDGELLAACRRLWDNMTERQMYITGGIGSMAQGEAFSFDYDLPNDTVYAETCASIGLVFAAQRMLRLEPDAKYADALERALYNTVVGGMSRDGKHFFYVNPLEVDPKACGGKNKKYDHVKPVRQEWFGCACCPPNVARLLASLGSYVYTAKDDAVYAHLYVGGEAELELGGTAVTLVQQSDYPWSGDVRFEVKPEQAATFKLCLRLPDWSPSASIRVNGTDFSYQTEKGYAVIERTWQQGDTVELALEMPIMRIRSNPLVRGNAGKVALQRGPLVYCLEQADNGADLHLLLLPQEAELKARRAEELLDGIVVIEAEGLRENAKAWGSSLYSTAGRPAAEPERLTFIPYYAWANRGEGEMTVWVREG
ncbi:glycoside hydrolase family 127 protein [Paenibacillus thailandensis]|uniref:Glycoside hydrolase family 127 protein n=1 Tax=Paenibacillus thailandensis TaxID=393250 RepID=A0ABW5QW28_9BACL